ncbi:MAG: hypothetical protein ACON4H_03405 [Rubripirellula sp.]
MRRSRETPSPAINSDVEKAPNSSLKTLWFDFKEVPLFLVDAIPDLPIETIGESRVLRRSVWHRERILHGARVLWASRGSLGLLAIL